MDFSVAIGTKHHTFIQLFLNPIPTSSISFIRYAEVFSGRIVVMKFKCVNTAIVAAYATFPAFVLDSHKTYFSTSLVYGPNQILAAIAIFSPLFLGQLSPPFMPRFAQHPSDASHSHLLYRLSYRGKLFSKELLLLFTHPDLKKLLSPLSNHRLTQILTENQ